MRLLVLGGTVFLGRHVTAEALRRGHEVTVFHRGRHGADLFGDAEHVLGDRAGDLTPLRGRAWDAAVDTSGYEPADVARSSALDLGHLVFVSSCNVYPAWPAEPVDEDSPVWTEGDDYGPLKAECERVAEAAMPGRVASVRAGLICGPHDNIFRLPWWSSASRPAATWWRPATRTARSSSSTRATSPPGCSTSPRRASRAPSTAPRHRAARPCARRSTRRCRRPGAAPGCAGCPTRSSWRTTSSRGTSCRSGSRPRPVRGRGRWAPSGRRRRGCAAGRWPRPWPTRGPGCATAEPRPSATGARRTARAG